MNLATQELTIALDVGGTEIKAGLLKGSEIVASRRWPTERELGPDRVVDQVLFVVREMLAEFPNAKAVGLVVPGVVSAQTGIAKYSENIGWKNIPFVKLIKDITSLPVGFGHDVRAGGVAESLYGAGRGFKNSFFMPVGTGISGAIIINGQLLDGPYSGEIGHLDVKSGLPCACESSGCLETVSTGPSITRAYNLRSSKQATNSRDVLEAAQGGDSLAAEIWANAMDAIAFALTAYVDILAPEVIIIGGGVSKAGDAMLKPIEKHFDQRLTFLPRPKVVLAELGDHAGMIGAGIAASEAIPK